MTKILPKGTPQFFTTQNDFRKWLLTNGSNTSELWVGFYKKISGKTGMNYAQALDEALCFGWIDGLVRKHDDLSYMQRFTPRRPKSIWSKINTKKVEKLENEGKMMPAGNAAVESAKKDGRWQRAYESYSETVIPKDFLTELQKITKAKIFFETLNKANTYAIGYRLYNTKNAEARTKKISEIILKLSREEKFH